MSNQSSFPSLENAGIVRRPSRLADEVYNAIYAQLMSLKIPPNGRIAVDNLVREFGVSQTPIREALSRLEAQGLVIKTHLIGYSAAPQLDRQKLEQLYELRLLVEPYAAARAAEVMSNEGIAHLEAVDGRMRAIQEDGSRQAYGEFAQIDGMFHDAIALGSANTLIHEALGRLHTHIHLFRLHFHAQATSEANSEHALIISAIRERQAKQAERAMRAHIERSATRFMAIFRG